MASKRRKEYLPIGKDKRFNVYHEEFDRLRMASEILNPSGNISVHMTFWDKHAMEYELQKLVGIADGQFAGCYFAENKMHVSVIPTVCNRLLDLEDEFKRLQHNRRLQGYAPSDVWPADLFEKKLKLQAMYDVYTEESELLAQKISEFVETKTEAGLKAVLQYGLKGSGKLRRGKLDTIDGQSVKQVADGLMVINEPTSPYHGMAVADYRQLALSWRMDERNKLNEKLKVVQQQAKELGLPIPQSILQTGQSVSRGRLPEYPVEFKNYSDQLNGTPTPAPEPEPTVKKTKMQRTTK